MLTKPNKMMCLCCIEKLARKQKRHQETQPRYHTKTDHDIIESEESQQTAETRPRQTDHTPRQTG